MHKTMKCKYPKFNDDLSLVMGDFIGHEITGSLRTE